jgi:hypothetical protein
MTQIAEGDQVTSPLIFRFKDGSVYASRAVTVHASTLLAPSQELAARA